MVVSEIGEQWSPHTAPAIQAEIAIIVISDPKPLNAAITIGIRIPNVPHDVPVAKEIPTAIRNTTAGRRFTNAPAVPITIHLMKFSYHQGDLAVLSLCFKNVPLMAFIILFILICSHSLPLSLYFLLKGGYHNSEPMDYLHVMM